MGLQHSIPDPLQNLIIQQPRDGYRFAMDALLLAAHIEPKSQDRVLELGAGCGVVALNLASRYPFARFVGVELQAELARLARENVAANGFTQRISILCRDMRELPCDHCGEGFDWVISNPPYRRRAAGRVNPHPQRAIARHEIAITLPELVATVQRMLRSRGRLVMIYSSERLAELLALLTGVGLEPKWVRCIHTRVESPARLVLVGAGKGTGPGLQIRPPLIIYYASGVYSPEAAAILGSAP